MQKNLNVLIVEDHPIIVEAYTRSFENLRELNKIERNNYTVWNNLQQASSNLNDGSISEFDIVLLDIQLPPCDGVKILSGEDVGIALREKFPKIKILVITSLNDNYRIQNILKSFNPEGLVIKGDIGTKELELAIQAIIDGDNYFSKNVSLLMRSQFMQPIFLEPVDRKLLYELAQGSKTKDLCLLLNLSLTSVERRKRRIKENFNIEGKSDRALLNIAKEKGFL
jgi:DNA-binding NarL/FixJ family response regulator